MWENSKNSEIKVAVISDIHGNRWALETVLDDIKKRQINHLVNLGDSLYGPLDPRGTADLLVEYDITTVSGNEDRLIWESYPDQEIPPTLDYVRKNLSPVHLDWLRSLELTRTAFQFFYLCHGTPISDTEYLLKKVSRTGVVLRKKKSLMEKLKTVKQEVVLCGHDHMPALVKASEKQLVVNPGSVGLPAYRDDIPFPHVMEAGSPHTRYAVISKRNAGWHIENMALAYDWKKAAESAKKNGRLDWAEWLKTGRAGI
jgi:putative phosphoesterase